MKQMFESATLKMTAWYMLILITISLLFSIVIYQISTHELDDRFNTFQSRIERGLPANRWGNTKINDLREDQAAEAKATMFVALLYTNLVIIGIGGIASYFLARHTLRPIEESHEAEVRFSSNASHELRTPLAVMKSEIEVALRDKNSSSKELREILESNLEEVNRLTALSHTLLQLSRGQLSPQDFSKIDLLPVIKKAIQTYENKSRKLVTKLPRQLRIERGNTSSLGELYMIVLENAYKYSHDGSVITIEAAQKDDHIVTTISNEGKGISADDLPHVFERFYRGDKSHTSADGQQGYGLGLALAKQIVTLHGGSITIESTPDVITTVTILLPKYAKTAYSSDHSQ